MQYDGSCKRGMANGKTPEAERSREEISGSFQIAFEFTYLCGCSMILQSPGPERLRQGMPAAEWTLTFSDTGYNIIRKRNVSLFVRS